MLAFGGAPFAVEQQGEGAEDVEAAAQLLAGFLDDAVDEFEVVAHHPLGGALRFHSAEKLERRAHGDHHSAAEVGFEFRHEYFLLRGAEGDPHYVGPVFLDHAGDRGVVEFADRQEGELDEPHAGNVGVHLFQVRFQAVECGLLRAEEDHAVLPARNDVAEYLAAAVLLAPLAVDPFDVEGDVAAVADGEHAAVDHPQILRVAVGGVENHAVGHAYIVGTGMPQPLGYGLTYAAAVKLVAYLEICV